MVLFRFVGNLKNWSMVEKFFQNKDIFFPFNESVRFLDNFYFVILWLLKGLFMSKSILEKEL